MSNELEMHVCNSYTSSAGHLIMSTSGSAFCCIVLALITRVLTLKWLSLDFSWLYIGGGNGTASTAIAVPKLKKLGLSRTKVALVDSWYHFVDVR